MMQNHRKFQRRIGRTFICLICTAVLMIGGIVFQADNVQAKTYNQKGYALQKYNIKDYKILKNKNYGKASGTQIKFDIGAETPHTMTTKAGNKKTTMTTWMYLPNTVDTPGDMGNPQAIVVTPDGQYAYLTYLKKGSKTVCRIVRYDLKKLKELGITQSGKMDDLRYAFYLQYHGKELDDRQKQLVGCVKFGPWAKFGHGCAFAYNPKDKHIWFVSKTGVKKTDLQRVNMSTLKPDLKINYKTYATVAYSNNLTFDKKGRFYFISYSSGGWAPKGTVKIYQGKINLKKKKKVTINMIMQGIRYSVSKGYQSIGYNPKKDRLYLVANSGILSMPVSKLGKLKKKDVWSTIFKEYREFEGMAFDKSGKGYLLVNNQPEIMSPGSGF